MEKNYGLEEIQSALLDILVQIDKLCKKHNITYFLDSGTLLGAVRHKGFIPWDDDMDIMLTRENFEKFCKVINELPAPYKFISPKDYNGYFFDFVPRVINPEFAIRQKTEEDEKQNDLLRFASVDFFIIDNAPNNKNKFNTMVLQQKMLYGNAMAHRCNKKLHKHSFVDTVEIGVLSFFGKHKALNKIFEKQKQISTKYKNENTKYFCRTNTIVPSLKKRYPKKIISEAIEMPFYFKEKEYSFPCPKGYDEFLTILYGDYMTPPPEDQRVPAHAINNENKEDFNKNQPQN